MDLLFQWGQTYNVQHQHTEQRYLEIWDGFSWVSVAGATGSISFAAAEDLAVEYVLTLG